MVRRVGEGSRAHERFIGREMNGQKMEGKSYGIRGPEEGLFISPSGWSLCGTTPDKTKKNLEKYNASSKSPKLSFRFTHHNTDSQRSLPFRPFTSFTRLGRMSGRSLADAWHKKGRRLHHPTTVPPADCRNYPYPFTHKCGHGRNRPPHCVSLYLGK